MGHANRLHAKPLFLKRDWAICLSVGSLAHTKEYGYTCTTSCLRQLNQEIIDPEQDGCCFFEVARYCSIDL